MNNIEEINGIIEDVETSIGRIKVCRAISAVGTVGFSLATLFFAQDKNFVISSFCGAFSCLQGLRVYCDSNAIKDLKLEKRSLYLEKQQLERQDNQPKIMGLRRIK